MSEVKFLQTVQQHSIGTWAEIGTVIKTYLGNSYIPSLE
jgi:hypothetical protein